MKKKTNGFTLVELMLSIAFISLLMVAIATTAIFVSNTYTKGLTLREVNQAGRLITQELQRLIAESGGDGSEVKMAPISSRGGRICFGKNTIFWNTKEGLDTSSYDKNVITVDSQRKKLKLYVRNNEASASYCETPAVNQPLGDKKPQDQELLPIDRAPGGVNLVLYKFEINHVMQKQDTIQSPLYKISFTIGTDDKNIINHNSKCHIVEEDDDNLYCAINKFEFIARPGISKKEGSL